MPPSQLYFYEFVNNLVSPGPGAVDSVRMFTRNGNLCFLPQKNFGGFYREFTGNLTENRQYVWPDASGTIALVGGGGVGTVTKVTGTGLSPLFSLNIATPTTTPAISFSPVSQAQNLFYASPNGVAGFPAFRSIVATDIVSSNASGFLTNDGAGNLSWTSSAGYITGGGTLNTIPLFTPSGTALGNSIITQSGGSQITVGGNIYLSASNSSYIRFANQGSSIPTVPSGQFALFNYAGGNVAVIGGGSGNSGYLFELNSSTQIAIFDNGSLTANRTYILPDASGTIALVGGNVALTNAHIFVGNSGNIATDVAVSGDLSLANTGVFTIGGNVVTYAKMQQASPAVLLGNSTGSMANIQQITLGTGLSFSGSTLVGTGGTVTSFSATGLSPLFSVSVSNPTTTPSLSFTLTGASTNQWFGENSSGTIGYNNASALTTSNDTNVTITTGGNASTALLYAASLTMGWTGQLSVPRGGTGVGSFIAYSVICGGTGSTGNLQNVSGVGTSGQVLTSNGPGTLPTWQTIPAGGTVTSITAGTGLTGGTITTSGTIALSVPVSGENGGTGVANTGFTITLGGNLTTSGAFNTTFSASASNTYTLPTATSTLLANNLGISGGTTLIGDTASAGNLILSSTSNATKGLVYINSATTGIIFNETTPSMGIGVAASGSNILSLSGINNINANIRGTTTTGSGQWQAINNNSTHSIQIGINGTGKVTAGLVVGDWSYITSSNNLGMYLATAASAPFILATGGTGTSNAAMYVDSSQRIKVGAGVSGASTSAYLAIVPGTSSIAPLQFTSGTSLTSPVAGSVEYDGNAMWFTPSGTTRYSVPMVAFTGTQSVTVANTTTQTSLVGTGVGTMTIPTNYLVAGKTIRVNMSGIVSTDTAIVGNGITFTVKVGSTTFASDVIASGVLNSLSNNAYNIYFDVQLQSVSANTGTFVIGGGGDVELSVTSGISTKNFFDLNNGGSTKTAATNSSQLIDILVTWGTASSSNTITNNIVTMEILN